MADPNHIIYSRRNSAGTSFVEKTFFPSALGYVTTNALGDLLVVTNSFANYVSSASYASASTSASYAINATTAEIANEASLVLGSNVAGQVALAASANTATFALNWNSSSIITLIGTKQNLLVSGSEYTITSSFANSASHALIADFAITSTPFDPAAYLSSSTFTAYISGSENQFSGTSSYASSASYAVNSPKQNVSAYLSSSTFTAYMSGSGNQFEGTSAFALNAPQQPLDAYLSSSYMSSSTSQFSGTSSYALNSPQQPLDAYLSSSYMSSSTNQFEGTSAFALNSPQQPLDSYLSSSYMSSSANQFEGTSAFALNAPQQPLDAYLSSSYMSSSTSQFSGTSSYALNSPQQPLDAYLSSSYMSSSTSQFSGTSSYAISSSWAPESPQELSSYLSASYMSGSRNQFSGTSSYTTTASYALNGGGTIIESGSYWNISASQADSSSHALIADFAISSTPFDPSAYLSASKFTAYMSGSENRFEGTSSYTLIAEFALASIPFDPTAYLSASKFTAFMSGSSNKFEGTSAYATSALNASTATNADLIDVNLGSADAAYRPTMTDAAGTGYEQLYVDNAFTFNPANNSLTASQFKGDLVGTASHALNAPQQPLGTYLSASYMSSSTNQFEGTSAFASNSPQQPLGTYLSASYMSSSTNQFEGTSAFASNSPQQPLGTYLSASYMSSSTNQFEGTSAFALNSPQQPLDAYLSSSTFTAFMSGSTNKFEGTSAYATSALTAATATNASSIDINEATANAAYRVTMVDAAGTGYEQLYVDANNLIFNPSDNSLTASKFSGDLSGTASYATYAGNSPKRDISSYLSSSYMSGSSNQFSGTSSYAMLAEFALASIPFDPTAYLSSSVFTAYMSGSTNQFAGTSSFATSASYALNGGGGGGLGTGSTYPITASHALTASYMQDILSSATLIVDQTLGNDLTGERGNLQKPFVTVASASLASQTGDTIQVRSGSYLNSEIVSGDVTWEIAESASVTWLHFYDQPYNIRGEGYVYVYQEISESTTTISNSAYIHSLQVNSYDLTSLGQAPIFHDITCNKLFSSEFDAFLRMTGSIDAQEISGYVFVGGNCKMNISTNRFYGRYEDDTYVNSKVNIVVHEEWVTSASYFIPVMNPTTKVNVKELYIDTNFTGSVTNKNAGAFYLSAQYISGSIQVPTNIELNLTNNPFLSEYPTVTGNGTLVGMFTVWG